MTVVLANESNDSVIVVGIVANTVTVWPEVVLAAAPSSRILSIEDDVTTSVVVTVDSKDKVVVTVRVPEVITAGFTDISTSSKGATQVDLPLKTTQH